ncbi:MAG: alpha/beta hydrolase [Pseudomonadota bacterium]
MIPSNNMTLPESLEAERFDLHTQVAGRMAYYADRSGTGRPLVLLHSINASPTAIEVAPLFDYYRGSRPVYAPELPGFGFSERSDRDYTPILFANAIREFLEEVVGEPADVVALSTTSEFVARGALDATDRYHSLVLISPTGMGSREPPSPKVQARLRALFGTAVIAPGLYRLLTSRASIRYFLGLSFQNKPPVELIDQACATVKQPGASYAPFSFLSMGLFTAGATELLYKPLNIPTLVLFDKDPNINFDYLRELEAESPLIQSIRISPSQGLPHFDEPEQTFRAMDGFWQSLDGAGTAA